MHKCKNCGETDLTKFGRHSVSKKHHGYCRQCRSDRYREKSKSYYKSDKGRAVKAASDKKYYLNNKDKIKNYNKEYRERNKEILAKKRREYYNLNKESVLLKCKQYKKNNKDIVNKRCALRRAVKLMAACYKGEFNDFIIDEAYSLATLRTSLTKIKWHVDHIIPLNNKIVCGLHVGINLQVIPYYENLKKSNSFMV